MKKGRTICLSTILLALYVFIVLYVFFAVLHIDALDNFVAAIVFETIGFVLLVYFIIGNMISKPIKTGFFVPLVVVTIVYTIILDVVNMVCVTTMPQQFFILANLILLLIYGFVSLPMYIMGRR